MTTDTTERASSGPPRRWINRTIIGIALATCFSDFSHEMVTAVLPLYLAKVGLGAAALGIIEGIADFLVSMSKLGGGYAGHHIRRKKPLTAAAYLVTAMATSSIALVTTVPMVLAMRSIAWIARGFRGPLRDYLLSDAVEKSHYGRAYGLERAADMIGAVAGPLTATLLVYLGIQFKSIILFALAPGVLAACSMLFLAREKVPETSAATDAKANPVKHRLPRVFWLFLVGVLLFGMGDFSRTFLILIAAGGLKENEGMASGTLSIAVLLYAMHNLISAFAAFPAGHLGDRFGKRRILIAGYAIGVGTNLMLAFSGGSLPVIIGAIALSGIYIAVEETLEKATVAQMLPRELKSLGFGILACANAVGDMASSVYVGTLMGAGRSTLAFSIAAGFGALGVVWMFAIAIRAVRAVPREP
jgi:MFS family permease